MLRFVASLLAALTLAITGAGVAAQQIQAQSFLSALYADFRASHATGLVLIDRIDADSARITTALGHLLPNHRYQLTISGAACGAADTVTKRIARVNLGVHDAGDAFVGVVVRVDGGLWAGARSMRLMEEEGIYYFCRAAHQGEAAGAAGADGAFARFQAGARRGLTINTGSGADQLSVVSSFRGLAPDTRYRLVHSPLSCAQFLDGDPDQPIVIGSFRSNGRGTAMAARTETVGKDETFMAGSNRVERRSDGAVWSCANLHQFKSVG